MKPYYEHAGIKIYHGDCREILPTLTPLWGLILTDPQYGIDHPCDYATRGRGLLAACSDYAPVHGDSEPFNPSHLLSFGCPTVLWGANHYASRLPDASGWLVWDKLRPDDLDQATCELAWTNFVKGVRRYSFRWNGMLRDGNEDLFHPTQKPVALMKWVLSLRWTPEGGVCDPYMGSGPVLIAAKAAGRWAIGIEIEESYCEIAAKRLSQEVFQFTGDRELSPKNLI